MAEQAAAVAARPTAGDDAPRLSQLQRIACVFYAPSRTFTDVRRNASWWLPFLLSAIVGWGFVYAVQRQVGWDKVVENTIQQSPQQQARFASMPAEQAASVRKTMAASFKYFSYAGPIFSLLIGAVVAGVLLASVNFLFGGRARYGQMLAVYFYGLFPLNLKYLLAIVVIFAGVQPEQFRYQNPIGTNLGFYLNPDTSPWLMALATQFGIFTVWGIVLLAIGCAILGGIKRSQAYTAIVAWWLLMTIAIVGWAAMSA